MVEVGFKRSQHMLRRLTAILFPSLEVRLKLRIVWPARVAATRSHLESEPSDNISLAVVLAPLKKQLPKRVRGYSADCPAHYERLYEMESPFKFTIRDCLIGMR